MAIVQTTFNLDDIRNTMEQLDAAPTKAEKVIIRTVSDFKKRAPGWVATEVTKVYNVKKKDISTGKIGSMSTGGQGNTDVALRYRGRLLTPTHFGMTPKKPPKNKSYTLKASIFKGHKVVLGKYKHKKQKGGPHGKGKDSGFILFPTGSQSENGVSHIPMMRKADGTIVKLTTLSLPQMITNPDVSREVNRSINLNMQRRAEHHMNKLLT